MSRIISVRCYLKIGQDKNGVRCAILIYDDKEIMQLYSKHAARRHVEMLDEKVKIDKDELLAISQAIAESGLPYPPTLEDMTYIRYLVEESHESYQEMLGHYAVGFEAQNMTRH
jgi:hypothetical protein